MHKAGKSLREIAEETSLGLRTVRTIIAKGNGAFYSASDGAVLIFRKKAATPFE